jgi:DNA-binding MarR family transcriptional regulator
MNPHEEAYRMSALIGQQLAFLAKFRELFEDDDDSPQGRNQVVVQRLQVLLVIKQYPKISPVDIAAKLKISPAAAGRQVSLLSARGYPKGSEGYGLLKVERDPTDYRRTYYSLNKHGEELMERLFSVFTKRGDKGGDK